MYPVNYGEIFPISGGLPVSKRPPQRQKFEITRIEEMELNFLNIKLNTTTKIFPIKISVTSVINNHSWKNSKRYQKLF